MFAADNHLVDSPAADNLAVVGIRLAGSRVVGSHLVDNLAVGIRLDRGLVVVHSLVDRAAVVVRSLVVGPAVADSLLVVQVDWDPAPGLDSMTSILPHFFPPDIDEFTMTDKRIESFTCF